MRNGRKPWKQCRNCGCILDSDVLHCSGCSKEDTEEVFLTSREVLERVPPCMVWTKNPPIFYELLDERRRTPV